MKFNQVVVCAGAAVATSAIVVFEKPTHLEQLKMEWMSILTTPRQRTQITIIIISGKKHRQTMCLCRVMYEFTVSTDRRELDVCWGCFFFLFGSRILHKRVQDK